MLFNWKCFLFWSISGTDGNSGYLHLHNYIRAISLDFCFYILPLSFQMLIRFVLKIIKG